MAKLLPAVDRKDEVDLFMANFDHPLKAEVLAVRDATKGIHPGISEQVKWNAPTFGYRGEYLFTFHLRPTDRLHLVFHNPRVPTIASELLEGNYADGRRMTYFRDAAHFEDRRPDFERILRELVGAIDAATPVD